MPIDAERVVSRLMTLARTGATADGGVTRLAFTRQYREAETLVRGWMEEAGLRTRIDAAGNLIGRREGAQAGRACVMLGSHIDTVVNGGRYDGALGVVGAIETAQALREDGAPLNAPLEVVAFTDEDGARWKGGFFGSRALAGVLDAEMLERADGDGVTRRAALRDWGLDPDDVGSARRERGSIAAYVELHIEQGAVLESIGLAVGVVSAIAGTLILGVRVRGRADHAGATPMGDLRQDALAGAAQMALAAEHVARAVSPSCVATVGHMQVSPNVSNVIPGEVYLTFDIRDVDEASRNVAESAMRAEIKRIARRRKLRVEVSERMRVPPVPIRAPMIELIARACEKAGAPAHRLPSGAGHDAQIVANIADAGMIFVRCRGGISHSPEEYAAPDDIRLGVQVLHAAALELLTGV